MMNVITIITPDFKLLEEKGNFSGNVHISFAMKDAGSLQTFSIPAIHSSGLFTSGTTTYSLYIDLLAPGTNVEQLAGMLSANKNILLQHSFHFAYHKIAQQPVFCFSGADRELPALKSMIAELTAFFQQQGYPGIQPLYFSDTTVAFGDTTTNYCFPPDAALEGIQNEYYDLLQKQLYSSKYIGIRSAEPEKAIQQLITAEKKFSKDQPGLSKLLSEFSALHQSKIELTGQVELLQSDLDNQKTYLKILKDKDAALEINNFYYNEYEILPLWYKRLGHIIKVIMGKRTLKSLFNDHAKKYKH